VATTVRVGRLTVRAARSGLGQDVVARLRAEALVASLDLDPRGLPDRSVLVLRQVKWRADRQLAATARATIDELRRTAARPARSTALGSAADAVLFADEAELLACLTSDALTGQLTRWYWRQLGPGGMPRIGGVLAAAWTARARWLPAALAALPAEDAIRAVSTLTPGEAAGVRQAMLAEFAGSGATPPVPDGLDRAAAATSGRVTTAPSSGTTEAIGIRPAVGSGTIEAGGVRPAVGAGTIEAEGVRPAVGGGTTAAGGSPSAPGGTPPARPAAPWAAWLRATPSLEPEQEALLGTAMALHIRPAIARRPTFVAQVESWLCPAARPIAAAPAARAGLRPAPRTAAPAARAGLRPAPRTAAPATSLAPGAASVGPAQDIMAPADGVTGAGLAPARRISARPEEAPVAPVPDSTAEPVPSTPPATAATVRRGVVSQFASVLYLVNVLCWLDLPATWPEGAAPGGWAILELLARHLLTPEAAPRDDPLWGMLAELDGRALGTRADAGAGADDPLRLPAAWLRRWAPSAASWEWAEARGRMTLADRHRGYVVADVPCAPRHGGDAAAAELARLGAAGVTGSLRSVRQPPASPPADPDNAPGWPRWRAVIGQFVAWLLASREVSASALSQPGRIAITRTHVDVVLDLDRVDLAARVCGLDRDPGWVPDLGRIVLFHFEAGG
jgi:hypothetical protein